MALGLTTDVDVAIGSLVGELVMGGVLRGFISPILFELTLWGVLMEMTADSAGRTWHPNRASTIIVMDAKFNNLLILAV